MTAALPDRSVVSDAELVHAAVAGDRAAFGAIYDRYANQLHDFCIGMLRNREAAADCVQDSFCIAAKSFSKLRDPAKLRPWLYAIARYEALRCLRERKREQAVEEVPEETDRGPGPTTLVRRNELVELIATAAGGLSDRDRAVYELAYRQGLEGAELAEALGVSASNAKKMAQRMRETVERSLGALLVSWSVRKKVHDCPGLAEILDGWDGTFTVLMRKRISRHIESCPTCDDRRRQLVNPIALLGSTSLVIPAPVALRQRTLDRVELVPPADSNPVPQHTDSEVTVVEKTVRLEPNTPGNGLSGRNRFAKRVVTGAALVAGLIAVPAVAIAVQQNHETSVKPANVTNSTTPPSAIGRSVTPTTTLPAVSAVATPTESGPAPGRVVVQDPTTTYEAPATVTAPPQPPPAQNSTSVAPTAQTSNVFTPPQLQPPTVPTQTETLQPVAPSEQLQPSEPSDASTGPPSPGRRMPQMPTESLQPVEPSGGDGPLT